MNDKQEEHLNDAVSKGESACCGAILYGDICGDCKEHSGPAEEEEDNLDKKIDALVAEQTPASTSAPTAMVEEHKPYDYMDWATMLDQYNKGEVTDLRAFWGEIQKHKYDSLIYIDKDKAPDANLHALIFKELELPILKQLFPEAEFKAKVTAWVKELYQKAKNEKKEKFEKYLALRKAGATYKDAKRLAESAIKFTSYDALIAKYARPFRVKYELDSKDADLLFAFGFDDFCKIFFEKFYQPIDK